MDRSLDSRGIWRAATVAAGLASTGLKPLNHDIAWFPLAAAPLILRPAEFGLVGAAATALHAALFGLNPWIGLAAVLAVIPPASFLLSRAWTFRAAEG